MEWGGRHTCPIFFSLYDSVELKVNDVSLVKLQSKRRAHSVVMDLQRERSGYFFPVGMGVCLLYYSPGLLTHKRFNNNRKRNRRRIPQRQSLLYFWALWNMSKGADNNKWPSLKMKPHIGICACVYMSMRVGVFLSMFNRAVLGGGSYVHRKKISLAWGS